MKVEAVNAHTELSATPSPDIERAKLALWPWLQAGPRGALPASLFDERTRWFVSHPFNQIDGATAAQAQLYAPLVAALPDVERRTDLFFGGPWGGLRAGDDGAGLWLTVHGHYVGTFRQPWLGIPATGGVASVRFGEFYRWVPDTTHPAGGRIDEVRMLLDIVDLARQAGTPILPRPTGLECWVPGPAPHDGLLTNGHRAEAGVRSMQAVMAMIAGLMDFDGKDLATMGMPRFWHEDMMWYGPGGIGTARGVTGFQDHHQRPFLHAFPDRKGGTHRARIAEGAFVASTGWPSVRATHGGSYLGVPASNQPITMRVADWWRFDGRWLTENWVLIDLPHLMLQMGVDLLARLPART